MSWAVSAHGTGRGPRPRRVRNAFTLIEVLVATALTLLLMTAVAAIFALVSEAVSGARATLEVGERLRAAQLTLQNDLAGLTARGVPPLDPAAGLGYTEIKEGPNGPCSPPNTVTVVDGELRPDLDKPANQARSWTEPWDTTVGDNDDVLIFTTRSDTTPFTGRGGPSPLEPDGSVEAQSNVAEVAWFVRGRTLYRRVLLVDPTFDASIFTGNGGQWMFPGKSFYDLCDISVRQVGGQFDPTSMSDTNEPSGRPRLVANSLGDLTKRENRYGHQPIKTAWPHDMRFWGVLGLPTLRECSHPEWPFPYYEPYQNQIHAASGIIIPNPNGSGANPLDVKDPLNAPVVRLQPTSPTTRFDAWLEPHPWTGVDPLTGGLDADPDNPSTNYRGNPAARYKGPRAADDVVLTNVLGFDVKVWDPGAPIFQGEFEKSVSSAEKQIVALSPGDPGYVKALSEFWNSPNDSAKQPISYGAFVDLGWGVDPQAANGALLYPPQNWTPPGRYQPRFHHAGNPKSALWGVPSDQTSTNPQPDLRARIYDTGSTHYESDGIDQGVAAPRGDPKNGFVDEGADGLDSSVNGIDDATEREAPPPYDAPLTAIQVKIRVFEPDSRTVREVTVVQELISQ